MTPPRPDDAAPDEPSEERPAREWRVRRVLVALDASPSSRAAAATAAELAVALQADLLGLFVEDAAIARLAGLPAASEVGSFAAAARPVAAADLGRRLRAQAERARRLFESGARRASLRGTFRVVRGRVDHEVAAAGGERDLLSLGRIGVSAVSRLGSVARAALARGRGPLLLLPSSGRLGSPVVAVYGGGATGRHALAAAARLPAASRRGHLVILLPAADTAAAERLHAEAAALAAALGLAPRFRVVRLRCEPGGAEAGGAESAVEDTGAGTETGAATGRCHPADRHALAHAVAAERAATLVLPLGSPLTSAADVETVVEALDCAVLLVR